MKIIRLEQLKLENFKGIKSLKLEFDNELSKITGANGSGKSSIYNAYLWLVFGIGATSKTSTIQPLDENGEPRHKITTSVSGRFLIDGQNVELRKELFENWVVARGTKQEVLKGLSTDYYYNDVPLSATEYKNKIAVIFDIDKWSMLSNVSAFFHLSTEERRRMLNSIAPAVDELSIAEKYPHVRKALVEQSKSIDEFSKEINVRKKKAQDELDEIPSRIDQQDKLYVDLDFSSIRAEKVQAEEDLKKINELIEEQSLTNADPLKDNIVAVKRQIRDVTSHIGMIQREIQREVNDLVSEREYQRQQRQRKIDSLKESLLQKENENSRFKNQLKENESNFEVEKSMWMSENKKEFTHTKEDRCSLCGQTLPAYMIEDSLKKATYEFNRKKIEVLKQCEGKASQAKKSIEDVKRKINSHQELIEKLETEIYEFESHNIEEIDFNAEYQKRLAQSKELQQAQSEEVELSEKLEGYETLSNFNTKEDKPDYSEQQTKAITRLNDATKQLAQEEVNKRIVLLKKELDDKTENLTKVVANCIAAEFEIQAYKKEKIDLVENAVSSLFSIVRWKMFEKNITNDGEKTICDAIVNGVPYNGDDLNTASKINAGVDVINGFCKKLDLSLPVFVDNKESVTELINSENQIITMSVKEGESLTIN